MTLKCIILNIVHSSIVHSSCFCQIVLDCTSSIVSIFFNLFMFTFDHMKCNLHCFEKVSPYQLFGKLQIVHKLVKYNLVTFFFFMVVFCSLKNWKIIIKWMCHIKVVTGEMDDLSKLERGTRSPWSCTKSIRYKTYT